VNPIQLLKSLYPIGEALIGYKTAVGKQNLKTCLHFLNFKSSSPSGTLLKLSALHAIRKFCMQFALDGILLFIEIALQAISDPFASCRKVFDYRMQYSCIFAVFLDFACGI
jgi:hypothetical protein